MFIKMQLINKDIDIHCILFVAVVLCRSSGLQSSYMFFRAPNNMSPYMIKHLTFYAPQIVVRALVYANVYLPCTYYKDSSILG